MSELKMGTITKQKDTKQQEQLQSRLKSIQNEIEKLEEHKKEVEVLLKNNKRNKKIFESVVVAGVTIYGLLTIKDALYIKNYKDLTKVHIDEFDSLGRHTTDDEFVLEEENAENHIICKIHGQYTKDENGNYVKPIYHYSVDLKGAPEIVDFISAIENEENQYANMDIDNLGILHLQKVTYDKKQNLSQEEYESEKLVQLQIYSFSTNEYRFIEYTEDEIITEFNRIRLSEEELKSEKNKTLVFDLISMLSLIIISAITYISVYNATKKIKKEQEKIDDEIATREEMKRALKKEGL